MRFIFNPATKNLETIDNVTGPDVTLGDKFKLAELDNVNTPDLEQSPDSFLRPGETLEDWDVSFRRPNAKGGLQRKGFSKAGMAMASNPLFRGTTGPSQILKAPRGYEGMKAILALENLPEANFLKKDESKKDIVERIETIKKEPKPPKRPKWKDYFQIAEKVTFDVAERRWSKKASKLLKNYFDNKAWNEKPIVTGSVQDGTRKSIIPGKNTWFYEGLNDYAKEKHGGNLKSAIRALSGETDQKKINSIYQSITQAGDRRGYIFEKGGRELVSDIEPAETIYKFTELTTNLRENPKLLDERVKSFDKNKVYNRKQLFDIFGIESGDRRTHNFVMEVLKDKGKIKYFPLPGGTKGFKLKDAKKALDLYSSGKQKNWEHRGEGSSRIRRSDFREKWDSGITNFSSQLYKGMRKVFKNLKIGDTKLYLPDSTSQVGHNPIPLAYGDQFDFLKNKKVKNKLFKLGNITWQDRDINRDVLMDEQGKLLEPLNIIEKYWGKKVTKNNIQDLNNARVLLQNYFRDVSDDAKGAAKGTSYVKSNVIGDFVFNVPQMGETIGEGSISVDMSKVDPRYIIGNVDLINPDAIKYNDLSKDEKIQFGQNVIDQKIKQIKDFYKDAGYGVDIIEDMIDALLVGHLGEGEHGKASKGLLERFLATQNRIDKAVGGPVLPTIPYRENFEDGSEPKNKMSDEEILESIRSGVFELEQNWNTEKSIPGKVLDVADVSNWPYYAARMLRAGMSVAEISAKLPFVSMELLGKLATQPAFKVKKADTTQSAAEMGLGVGMMEGMDDSWLTDQPHNKLEGTGLFTEAFKKLMPGTFADKTGLTSLIESQEQAMQDKGMSQWPEIAGKNIEMGLDITLPFGYVAAANKFNSLKKLLTPVVKNKDVNKVIERALTDKGMSRREFNTLIASGGIVAAVKALGLDSLFKGVRGTKELKTPIQMLKNTSTKMPAWFPKFIDEINKKMTYEGSGMYTFKGTDDFLPGFHIERISDDYYITGKNDYGQEFQVTYESPKWEGDADGSFYNKGDFRVDDVEPVHMDPDGNVDFDVAPRGDIDEVLGGTKVMEEVAEGKKINKLTKGEEQVIDAEVRAQSQYDMARDEGYFDDVE